MSDTPQTAYEQIAETVLVSKAAMGEAGLPPCFVFANAAQGEKRAQTRS